MRWFTRSGDPSPPVRPANAAELDDAVRLVLGDDACSARVSHFVELAQGASGRAGGLWIGHHHGRLVTAVLPVISQGRTMLLFLPAYRSDPATLQLTAAAVEAACERAAASGMQLAQALIETHDLPLRQTLESCGFQRLAELLYMQCPSDPRATPPVLPPQLHWLSYTPRTHALFARTIQATYEQSLDCPGLAGLRHMEDVIAGHKAVGEFDARLWLLLCRDQEPLGVLLLNPVSRADALDVVYAGLVPAARRRHLGQLLMQEAQALAASGGHQRLTLAVDASNGPAMRLYQRCGMRQISSKLALLRQF
jgi:ribosomal protein S18 acetylase RimI-like enzyme